MSKSKSPAFQFYPRDWLGDPEIMLMDWDARAMHLHLICIAWTMDFACAIPDDDKVLMKWLHVIDENDWLERLKPQITSAWELVDGRWIQNRLMREKSKQLEHSEKRKAAAQKRWGNKKEGDNLQSISNANALQMECPSTSTSTSTSLKKNRVFKPPELLEVRRYCQERKNAVDAQMFIDFYESKGWMIGKNKMKSWKAAVRTWEKRSNDETNGQNSKSRAKQTFDKVREIGQRDIEEEGFADTLD